MASVVKNIIVALRAQTGGFGEAMRAGATAVSGLDKSMAAAAASSKQYQQAYTDSLRATKDARDRFFAAREAWQSSEGGAGSLAAFRELKAAESALQQQAAGVGRLRENAIIAIRNERARLAREAATATAAGGEPSAAGAGGVIGGIRGAFQAVETVKAVAVIGAALSATQTVLKAIRGDAEGVAAAVRSIPIIGRMGGQFADILGELTGRTAELARLDAELADSARRITSWNAAMDGGRSMLRQLRTEGLTGLDREIAEIANQYADWTAQIDAVAKALGNEHTIVVRLRAAAEALAAARRKEAADRPAKEQAGRVAAAEQDVTGMLQQLNRDIYNVGRDRYQQMIDRFLDKGASPAALAMAREKVAQLKAAEEAEARRQAAGDAERQAAQERIRAEEQWERDRAAMREKINRDEARQTAEALKARAKGAEPGPAGGKGRDFGVLGRRMSLAALAGGGAAAKVQDRIARATEQTSEAVRELRNKAVSDGVLVFLDQA